MAGSTRLPVEMGCGLRAGAFSKFGRLALAETCPLREPAPRQPYLSEAAWSLFRGNTAFKSRAFHNGL